MQVRWEDCEEEQQAWQASTAAELQQSLMQLQRMPMEVLTHSAPMYQCCLYAAVSTFRALALLICNNQHFSCTGAAYMQQSALVWQVTARKRAQALARVEQMQHAVERALLKWAMNAKEAAKQHIEERCVSLAVAKSRCVALALSYTASHSTGIVIRS